MVDWYLGHKSCRHPAAQPLLAVACARCVRGKGTHQPTVLLSTLTSRRHRIMSSW